MMTDWRTTLRDAAAREREEDARLPEADALRMRAAVLAGIEADVRRSTPLSWMRPVALAATVIAMITVGIVAGRRLDAPNAPDAALPDTRIAAGPGGAQSSATRSSSRQLQFLTPGGTRIIWVFNSDLNLKATIR
jgi:hypothetical protein